MPRLTPFCVVTPEYNHSVPGVLKNAIDSVFVPSPSATSQLAAVGYSGGITGGVRAIEHLAQIAIEAEMVPLRSSTMMPQVIQRIRRGRPAGQPDGRDRLADRPRRSGLVVDHPESARAAGELPPAVFRAREAAAAVHEVEDEAL